MPRIQAPSLSEHRDWRRSQLIEAAAAIALESGGDFITVAAVASRAGLSRTAVYEYFASSADLVADLIIDELETFALIMEKSTRSASDPLAAIQGWITSSLTYIADGRHLLAKALNAVDLPRERSAAIGAAHRALLAPLHSAIAEIGITDIAQALSLLQSATDCATKRIEAGSDAEVEISITIKFCTAGLLAII